MNKGTLLTIHLCSMKNFLKILEYIKYHPIFMLSWGSPTQRMRKEEEDTKRGRKWKTDQCKWDLYKFISGTSRA